MKVRILVLLAVLLTLSLSLGVGWQVWAERHRQEERDWRDQLQQRLQQWFPEEMSLADGVYGFQREPGESSPALVLLHGLDEPGGIWDELQAALREQGLVVWPFRYPNDQAVELSADFLAQKWQTLPPDQAVVLIGHSMGGLVIRDFVTRHAPVSPAVRGVILVGTPNHGSEWVRLRVWLEVREQLGKLQRGEFSLFAALRDGTGAAKVDLRPESDFLQNLNARPWPDQVPLRIVGGVVTEPTVDMLEGINALERELGPDAQAIMAGLRAWWHGVGDTLGDGVVPVESLKLPGAPEPILLPASHRGLLVSRDPQTPAPAIAPILDWLREWKVVESR